ncbi:DUF4139 domain-containing protein, partial [Myxococcota bacterium]|nr:DUF4139 domain-containing protein [Myxococcota bacterium]
AAYSTPVYTKRVSYASLKASYRNLVSGAQVGSLFRYDIAGRVTIPDRSSSLVTLINKDVEGNDILYYITENYDNIPYRAVRYKNTSGYVLEKGPVAIYRGGQFVGEAIGGVVEKNATAFVPYAREGKVLVNLTTKYENEGEQLLSIWHGRVNIEERQVNKFVYAVENRSGDDFTMYVRRNRRTNWTPHDSKSFIFEKNVYYIPVKVKKGKSSFVIKETTPVRQSYGIYYYKARNILKLFVKSPDLPAALKKSIGEVLDIYDEVAKLRQQMSTIEGSRRVLREALDDARRNLKVLGKTGNRDLRRKIATNISKLSDQLTKLNADWVKLNMEKGEKERRMYTLFKMITFKKK